MAINVVIPLLIPLEENLYNGEYTQLMNLLLLRLFVPKLIYLFSFLISLFYFHIFFQL